MQTEEQGTGTATQKENPLRAEKRRKLDQLKAAGIDPFPHNFERSHKLAEIDAKFSHLEAGDVLELEVVTIAGRLMTKRDMGKASFFNIQDQSGAMQGYVKVSELDEQSQTSFKLIDIGDFVGFKGHIFKTKKG